MSAEDVDAPLADRGDVNINVSVDVDVAVANTRIRAGTRKRSGMIDWE